MAVLDGRALAEHARMLLLPHVEVAVIAGRDGVIPDLPGPDMGPLGGIAGALSHAAALGFTSVMTIGCDMPSLPDGLLTALSRRASAYCPDAPVLGHWETALLRNLVTHIKTVPRRSVRGWAVAIGAIPIQAAAAIPNVNTPQDLDTL
jgi:molybdopterin-guanine dinucleotide biosynthesis protein A